METFWGIVGMVLVVLYVMARLNIDGKKPDVAILRSIAHSKIFGVSRRNKDRTSRQELIRKYCRAGMLLHLEREPDNPADKNAISVWIKRGQHQLGYIGAGLAEDLSKEMDRGHHIAAYILNVTGGKDGKNYGVNIEIVELQK